MPMVRPRDGDTDRTSVTQDDHRRRPFEAGVVFQVVAW
jgi:hypothetical protein